MRRYSVIVCGIFVIYFYVYFYCVLKPLNTFYILAWNNKLSRRDMFKAELTPMLQKVASEICSFIFHVQKCAGSSAMPYSSYPFYPF